MGKIQKEKIWRLKDKILDTLYTNKLIKTIV